MIKRSILILFLLIVSAVAYAAPQISNVAITNTLPAYTADSIVCSFTLGSAGEDVWANVTWYKNSAAQNTVQKGPVTGSQTLTDTLPSSATSKGDSWYCSVNAYNSTDSTAAVSSTPITIANTDVYLNDIPAQFYVRNSGTKTLSLSSYAVDPDSDAITFSASNVDAAKVLCGISGQSLTFSSVGDFTGIGYCDVTANDGTYTTPAKRVEITVRNQQASLSVPTTAYIGGTAGQDRNQTLTSSFVIKNTGDQRINSIEISTNAASKYQVNFSLDNSNFYSAVSGFSLNTGEERPIYYKGYIPADMGSGDTDIGDIFVRSNEINSTISSFLINTESMLTFYDINVDVDGNSDNSISVSGDNIDKEAAPGSVVKIEVKLENEYSRDSEIDLEDVKITAWIEGIDDGDDLEEETDNFKIKYDSKSDFHTLTFNIPYAVDEGSYDIIIEAEGTDEEYGSEHKISTTLTLDIEKKSHFIKIMKAKLGSTDVLCNDYTTLDVELQNLGSDDEDEVILTVKNPDLGLMYTSGDLELVEDVDEDENEFSKIFTVDLRNKQVKAGQYPIEIDVFYSGDIISDTKTVYLTVTCKEEKEEEKKVDDTVILLDEIEQDEDGGSAVAEDVSGSGSVERDFLGGSGYMVLLVLANIIVIGAAVFLVFKFLIAPKK
jgi:hypothetical protein